jgi:two-component system nitrate/nitrite response regulator NarL
MPSSSRPSSTPPIAVAVGDGHPLFADALGRTIALHPRLVLLGCSATLAGLHAEVGTARPDVVVLDTGLLPRDPAPEGDAGWMGWRPPPALLLVAEQLDSADLYAGIAAGATGCVSKDATGAALCDAIMDVARGRVVMDPDAQAALAGEVRLRTRDDRPLLTPREREVLELIAEGRSAPQMARRLHVSTATVKTHQTNLYAKLGATERAEAVATAMRLGLLE